MSSFFQRFKKKKGSEDTSKSPTDRVEHVAVYSKRDQTPEQQAIEVSTN